MRVAVTGAPSALLRSCAATAQPAPAPHAASSPTVPAARAPNRKSQPTCRYAGAVPSNVASRNASGDSEANAGVNGSTATASTPVAASMARRSPFVMSFFRRSG